MKQYRVTIVTTATITFEQDGATEKSARYIAEKCQGIAAVVGERGNSKNLGKWSAHPDIIDVGDIKEIVEKGASHG